MLAYSLAEAVSWKWGFRKISHYKLVYACVCVENTEKYIEGKNP